MSGFFALASNNDFAAASTELEDLYSDTDLEQIHEILQNIATKNGTRFSGSVTDFNTYGAGSKRISSRDLDKLPSEGPMQQLYADITYYPEKFNALKSNYKEQAPLKKAGIQAIEYAQRIMSHIDVSRFLYSESELCQAVS